LQAQLANIREYPLFAFDNFSDFT